MNARAETTLRIPSRDECQKQVRRVLQSGSFRNASMIQQLLQYLAEKTFTHSAEPIKEYTIGVEALGRSPDFDPKADPIVRVQIHRLRQKLKEYYDSDGLHDYIVIEIPKGQYLPIFGAAGSVEPHFGKDSVLRRDAVSPSDSVLPGSRDSSDPHLHRFGKPFLRANVLIAVSAGVIVFVAGLWIGSRWAPFGASKMSATVAKSDLTKSSDPVIAFWAKYIGNDPTPVIAYPDAVFLLDNYNDLFRFKRGATDYRGAPVDSHVAEQFASNPALVARAGQLYYENSYLGFGELKAVGMLSNLFGRMGYKPIVKPSRELTVDDLTQHNVIMLGSSSQNIAVANFSNLGDFSFKDFDSRLEQWRGVIVNSRPRANEASTYHTERDQKTQVLTADYSLITIQPGIVPGRLIADFGGLDTTGSEGAVFYATSRSGVDELTKAIQFQGNNSDKRPFPVFQALLKVQLEKGYHVLGVNLVTVHMLPSTRPETREAGTTKASQP
ncbi:MAG TPA: hypothetical protein VME23_20420 [Terracidiphilus sp.]|nr:hypothetical protein [Terracidiphilus sp.]